MKNLFGTFEDVVNDPKILAICAIREYQRGESISFISELLGIPEEDVKKYISYSEAYDAYCASRRRHHFEQIQKSVLYKAIFHAGRCAQIHP